MTDIVRLLDSMGLAVTKTAAREIEMLRQRVKELEAMLHDHPNEEAEYYEELNRGYAQDRM